MGLIMDHIATHNKFKIKRRSSAHSAYWMCNALVPAGLIMMYKYGFAAESVLGLVFVCIGAVGYSIYKQKMRVPLVEHDGVNLTYRPSDRSPCVIAMDDSAKFTVSDLSVTAEVVDNTQEQFEISRLDFNSNTDWDRFVAYLRKEPEIALFIEH